MLEASEKVAQIETELSKSRERVVALAAEETRLHEAVQARDHALAAARADAEASAKELSALRNSTSWRVISTTRAALRRIPGASIDAPFALVDSNIPTTTKTTGSPTSKGGGSVAARIAAVRQGLLS